MSNLLTQIGPQTESEQEAILDQLFLEMRNLNEKIKQDQADIDSLKMETDLLRNETRAILVRLELRVKPLMKENERPLHNEERRIL